MNIDKEQFDVLDLKFMDLEVYDKEVFINSLVNVRIYISVDDEKSIRDDNSLMLFSEFGDENAHQRLKNDAPKNNRDGHLKTLKLTFQT